MYGNRTIIRIALLFALPWTAVLTAQDVPPAPTQEPAIEVDPSGEIKIFSDLYIAAVMWISAQRLSSKEIYSPWAERSPNPMGLKSSGRYLRSTAAK